MDAHTGWPIFLILMPVVHAALTRDQVNSSLSTPGIWIRTTRCVTRIQGHVAVNRLSNLTSHAFERLGGSSSTAQENWCDLGPHHSWSLVSCLLAFVRGPRSGAASARTRDLASLSQGCGALIFVRRMRRALNRSRRTKPVLIACSFKQCPFFAIEVAWLSPPKSRKSSSRYQVAPAGRRHQSAYSPQSQRSLRRHFAQANSVASGSPSRNSPS